MCAYKHGEFLPSDQQAEPLLLREYFVDMQSDLQS